jgi:predicted RNA binding protein YcfA (HicA-like mRNA interferase family)
MKIGWQAVHQSGSHEKLRHKSGEFPDYIWAFHDGDEIGPKMLARIAKHTGLKPSDI